MKSRTGLSLIEILISVLAIAILSLGLANFAADFFDVAHVHTQQIESINFTRFTAERISDEIRKAEYIYPSDISLSLQGSNINTNQAIAMLIPVDKTNLSYRFTAFYFKDGVLTEFHSSSNCNWEEDIVPAETMTSFVGSAQTIASDIENENAQLTYNLNYNNGTTDSILKGEMASVDVNYSKALIKSIKWTMTIKGNDEQITIDGVSHNVPRFIE